MYGTPAKRAERSKSCRVYSRLIGWDTGLFSSAAWKLTPSSIAFQRTVRPCRAASASIHSEAMYEYGDEKSNQNSIADCGSDGMASRLLWAARPAQSGRYRPTVSPASG